MFAVFSPWFSHDPFMSRQRNIAPRKHSSMHMAVQTPASPMAGAKRAAMGSLTSQMLESS